MTNKDLEVKIEFMKKYKTFDDAAIKFNKKEGRLQVNFLLGLLDCRESVYGKTHVKKIKRYYTKNDEKTLIIEIINDKNKKIAIVIDLKTGDVQEFTI